MPELIGKATCKRTQQQLPTLLGQQCWEWSCCVRVGSGVQTDVATPNNTQQHVTGCAMARDMYDPTTLGVVASF